MVGETLVSVRTTFLGHYIKFPVDDIPSIPLMLGTGLTMGLVITTQLEAIIPTTKTSLLQLRRMQIKVACHFSMSRYSNC